MTSDRGESRTTRLPALTDLSAWQQEISDRITSRRGGTRGPFLVWLRSPELCEKVEALGAYCRFESALDPMLLNAFQVDLQPVPPPIPHVRGYART